MPWRSFKTNFITLGRALFCVVLLLSHTVLPSYCAESATAAAVANTDDYKKLSSVSKQLLLKAIELNRYILLYRLNADKQPKTRIWRYPLSQEVAPACIGASDIIKIDQFGRHMNDPLNVSTQALRAGFNTALVGATISGAGSGIEFTSTLMRMFANKINGYDTSGSRRHFIECLKEIDRLLAQREAVANSFNDGKVKEILVLENTIMHELRNYQIAEFFAFHGDMTGNLAYEGTYYSLDVVSRTLQATTQICALRGIKQPQYAGAATIILTLSGISIIAAPLVATAVGHIVKKRNQRKFLRLLKEEVRLDAATLQQNLARLQELKDQAPEWPSELPQLSQRVAIYTNAGKFFQSQLQQETDSARLRGKVAIQSDIFGPIIGSINTTQGILDMTSYYDYTRIPTTLPRLTTADKLSYSAAILGVTSSAASLTITAALLYSSLSLQQRQTKEGRLPTQILQQRLASLDRLEEEIKNQ
jgi:hypothetical protein